MKTKQIVNANEEDALKKGMSLLRRKLYKRSVIELKAALEDNREVALKRLSDYFDVSKAANDHEAVMTIGEALLTVKKNDCELINSVGNSARRLKNYKKANDLYRRALRIDKSFTMAFFNLAASLARVDKYDSEVSQAIGQFDIIKGYRLPEYVNDPDIIENIIKEINQEREERIERIQSLLSEKENKQAMNDVEGVKQLIYEIEREEKKTVEPTYDAIRSKLKAVSKENWKRQTFDETKKALQENHFNLGLFALSQKDLHGVGKSFSKLQKDNCDIENFELLIALALDLEDKTDKAIERITELLSERPTNRYLNINLGLLHRKTGNALLSNRYLVKTAALLEESEGLYSLSDIFERAEEYFKSDNYKKALELYKIVVNELPTVRAWIMIGECYSRQDDLIEAIMAFEEIERLDPGNSDAKTKLEGIHHIYLARGEQRYRNRKYQEAADYYSRALELFQTPEAISKSIKAYTKLNDSTTVRRLTEERDRIEKNKRDAELEEIRLETIRKGKELMGKKEFNGAIDYFEQAFEMKPDKDVFMFLAHIYRGLKQNRRLSELMRRWRILMEREVRVNTQEKEVSN